MIQVTVELVKVVNPRHPRPDVAATKIQAALKQYDISTNRQVAMFMAQVGHESGLIPQEENLNYRASRIVQVWPRRFPSILSALPFEFNPKGLGDKVYGGRMGNAFDQGFLYRGRGPIQLTGLDNYRWVKKQTGYDVVTNPDLLLQYGVGFISSGLYFAAKGCKQLADRGDVKAVTRIINGGFMGLDEREQLYQRSLNRIVRYGLAAADPDLNVTADTQNDLDIRFELFNNISSLLAS